MQITPKPRKHALETDTSNTAPTAREPRAPGHALDSPGEILRKKLQKLLVEPVKAKLILLQQRKHGIGDVSRSFPA